MTTLKIDNQMNIVDIDSKASVQQVVGRLEKHEQSYKFTPSRLSMGLCSVPKRLTTEEQIQVSFILDEINNNR